MIYSYYSNHILGWQRLIFRLCISIGKLFLPLRLILFVVTLLPVKKMYRWLYQIHQLHKFHYLPKAKLLLKEIVHYFPCLKLLLIHLKLLQLHLHKCCEAVNQLQTLKVEIFQVQDHLITKYGLFI